METVIKKASSNNTPPASNGWKKLSDRFLSNWELLAAGLSGILILCGWLLSTKDMPSASAIIYLLAYVIGGYAKAKEGITQTIEERKLNVELLMIRRPPRSTPRLSSAASDVYKRQILDRRRHPYFHFLIKRCTGNIHNEQES